MTAEIAILNKNAVALAADSAVTVQRPNTQKIYNTANKLFMLSKYHPVGIMVYGTADLMGIPWETVIKIYRDELHEANFNRLGGFVEHFFAFLENNRALFHDQLQVRSLVAMCEWVLSEIRKEIEEEIKKQIEANGEIDDAGIDRIVSSSVGKSVGEWDRLPRLDCFPPQYEEELIAKYREHLDGLIDEVFGQLPVAGVRESLLGICAQRVTKDWWSVSSGGVVIAGFGKSDVFPVIQSHMVEVVLHNRLKHKLDPLLSNDMNETGAASIIPFAQAEIVHRFIRGVDPEYRRELTAFFRTLLMVEYPSKLLSQFETRLSEEEKRNTQAELIRLARGILSEFDDKWKEWERTKFINPVVDIVGDLPKDDLAAMAESLVNLTSFKRKITAEAETVGGPIDVAVISKGDGFVWIRRKHYFEKDLNPAFFANYYRRYAP